MRRFVLSNIAIAAFVLGMSNVCCGQGAHVRTSTNFLNPTNATTIAATFAGNSTAGNLIVVHLTYSGQSISITGVADNKTNSYTRINGPTNWNGTNFRSELWYAFNIVGGAGAITVTATLSAQPVNTGGLKFSQIYISEFSGIKTTNPLDRKSVNPGMAVGAGAFNSGAATTNFTNEMVYGAAIGGTMGTINVGPAFTSVSTVNSNLVEFRNVAAAGSNSAVFTATGAGTFVADMATFITNGSVLPVVLSAFDAALQEDQTVGLNWITSSELHNDYFELQRSKDALTWSVLGRIAGVGTSNAVNHYSATDDSPLPGINYYRLRQVDYNGKYEFSGVRMVEAGTIGLTRFYPNPVVDWAYLDAPENECSSFSLTNALGENINCQIVEVVKRPTGIALNLSNLSPGIYFARTTTGVIRIFKR